MVEKHPIFNSPEKLDQKIWRYMDFTKFVDCLNSSSLYFTRVDKLQDIFEGSVPKMTAELRNKFMITATEASKPEPNPIEYWKEYGQKSREEHAINCWHMNDYESAAMWKSYLKSDEGIAIQSDYKRLSNSLQQSEILIFIGRVNYIDYEKDTIKYDNSFIPFIHKRKSFSFENELRAVIWELADNNFDKVNLKDGGIRIYIDLNVLIENIFVSPDSPLWLTNLVKDTCKRFGYNFRVINSKLNDRPVY
jgi:hypothetical protein